MPAATPAAVQASRFDRAVCAWVSALQLTALSKYSLLSFTPGHPFAQHSACGGSFCVGRRGPFWSSEVCSPSAPPLRLLSSGVPELSHRPERVVVGVHVEQPLT